MYQRLILCLILMQNALLADFTIRNATGRNIKFRVQPGKRISRSRATYFLHTPIDYRLAPDDLLTIPLDKRMVEGTIFTAYDFKVTNPQEFERLRCKPHYIKCVDTAGEIDEASNVEFTMQTEQYAKILLNATTFIPTITISIDPKTNRLRTNFPANEKELQETINKVKEQTQQELKNIPVSPDPLKIIEGYADAVPAKQPNN